MICWNCSTTSEELNCPNCGVEALSVIRDRTRGLIRNRQTAKRIADALGYFWLPCVICGENYAGFEGGRVHLAYSDGGGQMTCAKISCELEARRRNKEAGFETHVHLETDENGVCFRAR